MKYITLFILSLFALQGLAQDTTANNTIVMDVEYIELADSVSIMKRVTYTYPNGQKVIRESPPAIDSIFIVSEDAAILDMFENRQQLVTELQRLTIEIQALDIFLATADTKYKALKAKKDKEKDK